jgi:hypothetical protein
MVAVRPGEEDDRVKPSCRRKRAGQAGWAGQRPRPSGGWRWWPNGRGKVSGPARVEGEAGRSWAESGAGPEFKKNSFRISIDFGIWRNFGKIVQEYLGGILAWGFFLKYSRLSMYFRKMKYAMP